MKMHYLDKLFLYTVGIIVLFIGVAMLWNSAHQNYMLDWQWVMPCIVITSVMLVTMYFIGFLIEKRFAFFSLIFKSVGMISLSWFILQQVSNTVAFTTPFSLYDNFFHHVDQKMGFHLLNIIKLARDNHAVFEIILF